MTVEGAFELVGALACVAALVVLYVHREPQLRGARPVAVGLLVLSLLVHLGEAHEWDVLPTLVRLTETVAILVPAAWLFLFFTLRLQWLVERVFSREDQLRLLLDKAPVPLTILDIDGRYLATSRKWRDLFHPGIAPASGGGVTLDQSPPALAFVRRIIAQAEEGTTSSTDPEDVEVSGGHEWLLWGVSTWFLGPQRKGGYVVILNVVTPRILADEETRQIQEHLQRLDRADLVSLLALEVAHDVRNFLAVVNLHAELLCSPDVNMEDLENSSFAIQKAISLSSNLLSTLTDMSRREQHEPTDVDLCALLESTRRMLKHSLPREIQLELDLATPAAMVPAVPIKLQQVLMNLVVNARDAMPDGGMIRIQLRTEGSAVQLTVTDTGEGMPPEILARIFERLYTTKGHRGGTGLGLAIVKDIIQEHQGSIDVQSTPGVGTTFTITLPTRREGPAPAPLPAPA